MIAPCWRCIGPTTCVERGMCEITDGTPTTPERAATFARVRKMGGIRPPTGRPVTRSPARLRHPAHALAVRLWRKVGLWLGEESGW